MSRKTSIYILTSTYIHSFYSLEKAKEFINNNPESKLWQININSDVSSITLITPKKEK